MTNMAGVTNLDIAVSSVVAMNGRPLSALRDRDRQISIVARLRADDRAQLDQIQNLYVMSTRNNTKVPLSQVSRVSYHLQTPTSAQETLLLPKLPPKLPR